MAERYNPFGLDYLRGSVDTPNYAVDSRWPDQPDVADAYRMGGLAAMDQYRMQDAPHAAFGAYDRAQGQAARDEAQASRVQRAADVAASLSGQAGPADIRPVLKGMRAADTIGEALAPDDVFGATTLFSPKRLGAIGKAIPAATGAVLGADTAEAAGARDPRFWHGISGVKLRQPIDQYSSVHDVRAPMVGKTVGFDELKGKRLLPTVGDTTVPNTYLEQIEAYKLPERVKMGGGGRFADVQGNNPDVWMSAQTLAQGLANKSDEIARKTGDDVLTVPTALSGTGGDYSHHVWSPLVDVLKDTKGISKSAREDFNAAMREAAPDFPGINARRDTLQRYFQQAPRTPRTSFAQIMDTRRFQDLGFPDVAAVRHAATDPELLHAPMGSSGYSVFRIDPQQTVRPSDRHGTYSHGITGQNVGSMGVIAPPELVFPDVMNSLHQMAQASGKPLAKYIGRPDYYFAGKIPPTLKGEPLAQSQLVDDKWINRMGDYAERYKKVGGAAALAAGMTLAEIAQAQDAGKMGDTADPSRYTD
jgi:hypothetical protein